MPKLNLRVLRLQLGAVLLSSLTLSQAFAADKDYQVELPAAPEGSVTFTSPNEADIPNNAFGDAVRYGQSLFTNTQQLRGKYVGNELNCSNCHINKGRKANAAPLWGAFPMYPAYRKKNDHVNTIDERIQGCFTYSMNGTPPPFGSKELTALVTYHYWLSTGAPVGQALPGRGYPKLDTPAEAPSVSRGEVVYQDNCAICHGDNGAGTQVDGHYAFPPLWGKDSFNWGAGMHRVNTAAGFIKANMPLGKPNSLTDQQAWDVAAFMNSHERPQDPRYNGNIAQTAETFHKHQCFYNKEVDNELRGQGVK
ncbi:cytochrome C [Amphritea opalescens]|uniref:Cytochrome C n=2 Tax=Amphritea opalescens TaxID=2490544 RepID=A0A430KRC5_9GAMM|nr:cytochrome C [Amphritea opalescens]